MLNTDIEHPYLEEKDFHRTLNRDILKVLADIRVKVPVVDYSDCYDVKWEKMLWLTNHFGLSLYTTDEDCAGYICLKDKELYVNGEYNDSEDDNLYQIISHEVGHMIQYVTGDYRVCDDMSLSGKFRLEQQCDAIASKLHPIVFGGEYKPTYNSEESLLWLRDWYGDLVENDIILK
jgi:hypothetical protein